jgi:uncharacterized Zn finger protein (UPF0148 family)
MSNTTHIAHCEACGHRLTHCADGHGFCQRCNQWREAETITAKPGVEQMGASEQAAEVIAEFATQ